MNTARVPCRLQSELARVVAVQRVGRDGQRLPTPEAMLADALNISVEALQEAQQEAHEVALAELVDAGYLTEEQVGLMTAWQALKEAIAHNELLAEVLGVAPVLEQPALVPADDGVDPGLVAVDQLLRLFLARKVPVVE